jgi:hypothetical protein
MAKYA